MFNIVIVWLRKKYIVKFNLIQFNLILVSSVTVFFKPIYMKFQFEHFSFIWIQDPKIILTHNDDEINI